MRYVATLFVAILVMAVMSPDMKAEQDKTKEGSKKMKLGAFSVSLAVSDIHKSKAFYEKLGFEKIGGEIQQNWLILQNDTTTVGLFQGMFKDNLMTFNPGWDHKLKTPEGFMDVRAIQAKLEKDGIKLEKRADPASTGPANFVVKDPDGNTILFDQHVAAPKKAK